MEISPDMLSQKGTHLFIKSNHWDEIEVDLSEKIPEGSLKYMHMCADHIKVNLPPKVTVPVMLQLCEVYPDLQGKIRKTFTSGGDISGLLR